jgi:hypothetical protein
VQEAARFLDSKDAITAAIAGAGLALSIYNTVQASIRNRVRLSVLPKSAVLVTEGAMLRSLREYPPGAMFCIEVINLSTFAVTIDEIGFTRRRSKKRAACPLPVVTDGKPWPRRVEPHESVSAYIDIANLPTDIYKAYAQTQSGKTRFGNSAALAELRKALLEVPPK